MSTSQRINKVLALSLGIARREADNLIAEGKVEVDGKTAVLGQQVDDISTILVDGQPITGSQLVYIALSKPASYVCSRKRQGDTPTIYELLPEEYHALKPVGRLDRDSSGIILLTNDGDFSHRMTHPSFQKTKVYEVALDTPLQPLHQQMISDFGVMLEDGKSKFMIEKLVEPPTTPLSEGDVPDRASQAPQAGLRPPVERPLQKDGGGGGEDGQANKTTLYQITMSEGRNRQIRRTFAALGYTVVRLHRTQFGPYALGNLPEGATETITHH